MRRIVLFLLILTISLPVFAQKNEQVDWKDNRRMALMFNPNPFIFGTTAGGFGISPGFEIAFTPSFAMKTQFYYLGIDPEVLFGYGVEGDFVSSFRLSLDFRWYPMQNYVRGIFANYGVQAQYLKGSFIYHTYEWIYDIDEKKGHDVLVDTVNLNGDNSTALGMYFGLGYKFVFGKGRPGLAIEPTLDYIWSMYFSDWSSRTDYYYINPYAFLGTQGLRFAIHLGVAF